MSLGPGSGTLVQLQEEAGFQLDVVSCSHVVQVVDGKQTPAEVKVNILKFSVKYHRSVLLLLHHSLTSSDLLLSADDVGAS